jgi:hypothetical protein
MAIWRLVSLAFTTQSSAQRHARQTFFLWCSGAACPPLRSSYQCTGQSCPHSHPLTEVVGKALGGMGLGDGGCSQRGGGRGEQLRLWDTSRRGAAGGVGAEEPPPQKLSILV